MCVFSSAAEGAASGGQSGCHGARSVRCSPEENGKSFDRVGELCVVIGKDQH